MIKRSFLLGALLVGLLLGVGICQLGIAVSQPANAQVIIEEGEGPIRYEYRVLVFTGMNRAEFEKTMNGWEKRAGNTSARSNTATKSPPPRRSPSNGRYGNSESVGIRG